MGMENRFDVEGAARAIMSEGRLVEAECQIPAGETFDAEDANALIPMDVKAGAAVKGQRSLLIEGSARGDAQQRCRIEVDGDLIVKGSVQYADIAARRITIGEDANACKLVAAGDAEIAGSLSDASTGDEE